MVLFFFLIDLYFFIPPVVAQIFNSTAELVVPIWLLSKEAIKIEIHPVIVEAKIRNCST